MITYQIIFASGVVILIQAANIFHADAIALERAEYRSGGIKSIREV